MFKVGDKVLISPKSEYKGLPHLRYRNRVGNIISKQGKCYRVEIRDGNKDKILICSSVHLRLGI